MLLSFKEEGHEIYRQLFWSRLVVSNPVQANFYNPTNFKSQEYKEKMMEREESLITFYELVAIKQSNKFRLYPM